MIKVLDCGFIGFMIVLFLYFYVVNLGLTVDKFTCNSFILLCLFVFVS